MGQDWFEKERWEWELTLPRTEPPASSFFDYIQLLSLIVVLDQTYLAILKIMSIGNRNEAFILTWNLMSFWIKKSPKRQNFFQVVIFMRRNFSGYLFFVSAIFDKVRNTYWTLQYFFILITWYLTKIAWLSIYLITLF